MGSSRLGRRLGALPVALAFATAASAQRAAADPQLAARLGEAMATAAPDLWGIALCTIDGKQVFVGAQGQQDRQAVAIDAQSLFDLGGLGGRITAVAALQLLRQKRWKLDDPIAKVLPDWPKDKAAISWRHLLQHTSGLPPEADWGGGRSTARRTAIAAIAATTLVDAPGTAFHWSVLNDNLLALAIESAGGDFQDHVRRRVFAPAGMAGAAFLDDKKLDDKHLTWRKSGEAAATRVEAFPWDWGQRGARGVLANATDVAAFGNALLGTRLLDAKEREVLFAPLAGGDAERVQPVVRAGVEWTQFHGAVAGYRARLLLQQKGRAVLVLLAGEQNLDALEGALTGVLAPMFAGSTGTTTTAAAPAAPAPAPAPAAAPPAAVALGPEQLQRFVGVFALPSGGRLEVARDGDGIVLRGLGLEASARLQFGRWPVPDVDAALRAAEDRCIAGLQPLVEGTGAPPAKCFAGDGAIAAARTLLAKVAARLGQPLQLQFAGTDTAGARQSWVRIVGPKAAAWWTVGWSTRGTIASVAEAAGPAPFQLRMRVERPDWAVGAVGGGAVTLSVEGRGASRTLVLEDQGGLLECQWIADLR